MASYLKSVIVWIFLLISNSFVGGNETQESHYDTIVIGLGAAGVTAASTLAKAGKKVLGLEAQGRIGGRVKTVPFGDGVVEEGAEWVHGTHPSRIYDLAVQNNLTLMEQDFDLLMYRSDHTPMDKDLVNELISYTMEVTDDPPETPEPLGSFVTRRLTDYIKEKHPKLLDNQEFLNEFFEKMNQYLSNLESSNDWNDVSSHTSYKELEGHQYVSWHRHGYKTFFEILLNTYNNGPGLANLNIKLNKEVTLIKWPQNGTGDVEVVCKDGDRYTASNVIVTVSLGVLKERYSTLFSPKLPADKITAIETISTGLIGKIILSFSEPWWPKTNKSEGFLFFWNTQDKEKIGKDDKWLTNIGLSSFPKGSDNTITLWTNGDVTKLVETLPEEDVKTKTVEFLRRFLDTKYNITEPTGLVRSTWYSNPFTRCTYTYDSLKIHQHPNARNTLAEPLLDRSGVPKVLFAGEATEFDHFSTVHGASDSGYREAMRIIYKV